MFRNTNTTRSGLTLLVLLGLLFAASCGGDTVKLDTKAGKFSGSAIADFSGPDAGDSDVLQVARQLMVNRSYDFTESGYTIAPGNASTSAGGNVSFGSGTGMISLSAGSGAVSLFIQSLDPLYSGAELSGSFQQLAAQSAIDNAGNTFTVSWELFYTYAGQDYEIHFTQVLTGTDFREV
jgi:hypothetical protein